MMDRAENLRLLGNKLVASRMYRRALLRYSDGLTVLGVKDLVPGMTDTIRDKAIALVLNSALW